MDFIFLIHVLASFMMTGLIWFVQVIHYPLFAEVPAEIFQRYELNHTRLTSYVVAPLMLTELSSACLLPFLFDQKVFFSLLLTNLLLLLGIWASTFFIQVPLHRQLSEGFSAKAIQKLVRSNWIRTVLWTLRAGILLILLHDIR